jgi:hypothetical protein
VQAFFEKMRKKAMYVEMGGDRGTLRTSMNMVITGNPGTGKTTVARLIAKYLYAFKLLPTDRFIERNALELKGTHVGQTAPKVTEMVQSAMGGCLFLDEAYALVDRGGDQFSGEAVRMLLTEVENNRTNLLVILAGYKDKMEDLLRADPGLPRRFRNKLDLPDYTGGDLADIVKLKAAEFKLEFADGLIGRLGQHITQKHGQLRKVPTTDHLGQKVENGKPLFHYESDITQSNGGLAVLLLESAIERMQIRVVDGNLSGDAVKTMVDSDFLIEAADSQSGEEPRGGDGGNRADHWQCQHQHEDHEDTGSGVGGGVEGGHGRTGYT